MGTDPDPGGGRDQVALVVGQVERIRSGSSASSCSNMVVKYVSGRGVKWSRSAVSTYKGWNCSRSSGVP